MKKSFEHYFSFLLIVSMMLCLASCEHEDFVTTVTVPSKPQPVNYVVPDEPDPFEYTPEVQEPIINDFTLLKACIGLPQAEIAALLANHGFSEENGKFLKTEGDITKEVYAHSTGNVEMLIHNNEFDILKQRFAQWMNEIHNSAAYTKLARSSFILQAGWGDGSQSFSTSEDFLSALSATNEANGMSASFHGNDIYANEYSLTMMYSLKCIDMQIVNSRAGQPSDDFIGNDLQEEDLHHHILISKVDYLTFKYKGFYAMDVSGKINNGSEIPFLAEYQEPCDFGYIKLYYHNSNNLLMNGTLGWCDGGDLLFPTNFRAGETTSTSLPYPGQYHFTFINNVGAYVTVTDELELQRVWQCVSRQREFQHYYGHTSKKVAVYRFPPSSAGGNLSDAYYLVFTEQ